MGHRMITQRFVLTDSLWACAGCRVRFSHNEDGQVFIVHHRNCPEMAVTCRGWTPGEFWEDGGAAERNRITAGVEALRATLTTRIGVQAAQEALTAVLNLING